MMWSLVLVAVVGCVVAEEPTEEKGVLVLTDATMKAVVESTEFILVEFYAPWCGHCKSLAPEYEAAAATLLEKGSAIKLAKVDATVEKTISEEYGVKGFPTLKFFKNGVAVEYKGPRDAAGIVAWLEKKTGPVCIELSEKSALDALVAEAEVVVVGFFDDTTGTNAKIFEQAAGLDDSNKYAFAKGDALRTEYKAKDNSVILIKNFDEGLNEFSGELDAEKLKEFVAKAARPNMFEFSDKAAEKIFNAGINKHFILISKKDDEEHADRIAKCTEVAVKKKEEIIFVHVPADKEENKGVLDFLGVKEEDLPQFLIFSMDTSAKYKPDNKEISVANVEDFVTSYLDGKLKPSLKTADLPADWDSKPVKVLVSTNFNEVAMDEKKDVFVEFYAPWCGHCKSLEPIWNELAEKLKDRSDVVIAKMDATENEVEGVEIQGFPTLKLFKKDNEVVDYDGGRDLASLVKFIETGEMGASEDEPEDEDDLPEDLDESIEEGGEDYESEEESEEPEEKTKDEL